MIASASSEPLGDMQVLIDNLPENVRKEDVKVKLIKSESSCKLEIKLPRIQTPSTNGPKLVTQEPPESAEGGVNETSTTAKQEQEDAGEKAGLYTIPRKAGVKLPMKVINPAKISTRMKDVGGYEEAKLEVIEFVNFIKNPEQYLKLGAHLPRGAILFGKPGTGKTLLARATAGEANVPFIACNSSEFLADGGVEKLADVFNEARTHSPCIMFFDEIDCLGRRRAGAYETPSVLHQALLEELLCQLDGFIKHEKALMIVLGATNDVCNMDPALLRPGRFDRTITMQEPNLAARCSIYMVHLRPLITSLNKKDLARKLAYMSSGFTGAKIATVCNESAMIAARDLNEEIKLDHFEQALDRVRAGLRKKVVLSEFEKKAAAYHDAAHGVFGWLTPGVDPPGKLSIVPTADSKVTCSQYRVELDNQSCTKENLQCLIMMTLAGKASEDVFLGDATAACGNDLKEVTCQAMTMVCKYGMSAKVGPMNLSCLMPWECCYEDLSPVGDQTRDLIISETKAILVDAYDEVKKFLIDHADQVEQVVAALIEKDLLSRDDLKEILGERPFPDISIFVKDDDDDGDFLPKGLQNWNIGKVSGDKEDNDEKEEKDNKEEKQEHKDKDDKDEKEEKDNKEEKQENKDKDDKEENEEKEDQEED